MKTRSYLVELKLDESIPEDQQGAEAMSRLVTVKGVYSVKDTNVIYWKMDKEKGNGN